MNARAHFVDSAGFARRSAFLFVVFAAVMNFSSNASSIYNGWRIYDLHDCGELTDDISQLAADSLGNIWVATRLSGLLKFDGTSWMVYNTANSGLPDNGISSIAIEKGNVMWLGTVLGLVRFDGATWTVYDTTNSMLPENDVRAIAIDAGGNKWIGTAYRSPQNTSLARFDGISWTTYPSSASGSPPCQINSMTTDRSGTVWCGTGYGLGKFNGAKWEMFWDLHNTDKFGQQQFASIIMSVAMDLDESVWIGTLEGGLVRFDNVNWTVYNDTNSKLPFDDIGPIAVDDKGNKWIVCGFGVVKFDGITFTPYADPNRGFPYFHVRTLMIDGRGRKWVGGTNSVAVYIGSDATGTENGRPAVVGHGLRCLNFPNPFRKKTVIKFEVPESGPVRLQVFTMSGRLVKTLVNASMAAGAHRVTWAGENSSNRPEPHGAYICQLTAGGRVAPVRMNFVE
jgi:hypothetical protein